MKCHIKHLIIMSLIMWIKYDNIPNDNYESIT